MGEGLGVGGCARSWRKEGSRSEEPLPLSLTALKSVGEQVPGEQRKSELPYRVQTQRQNSALWLEDTATKPTGDGLEPSLVSEVDPVHWKGGLSNKSPHGLGLESHQEASAVCLFIVSGKGEAHSGEFVVSSTCVLPGRVPLGIGAYTPTPFPARCLPWRASRITSPVTAAQELGGSQNSGTYSKAG